MTQERHLPGLGPSTVELVSMRSAGRWPGVDAGRSIAAAAIVWLHSAAIGHHTGAYGSVGRFAVPYFAALAVALTVCGSAQSHGLGRFATQRFRRIYLPFLFWTTAYLLLRMIKAALAPDSARPLHFGPCLLVNGSTHHLWFLPFALTITIAARVIAPILLRYPISASMSAVVIGVFIGSVQNPVPYDGDDPAPGNPCLYGVLLAWDALPSAVWGLAAGLWLRRRPGVSSVVAGSGILLTGALVFAAASGFGPRVLLVNASGCTLLVACTVAPDYRWVWRLAVLGRYSFGVYVLHIATLQAAESLLRRSRETIAIHDVAAMAVIAGTTSLATAWLMMRFRYSSWTIR